MGFIYYEIPKYLNVANLVIIAQIHVVNPRRACARVTVLVLCACVCQSDFFVTSLQQHRVSGQRNNHRRLHCNNILNLKLGISLKLLRWRVMECKASEQAYRQMSNNICTWPNSPAFVYFRKIKSNRRVNHEPHDPNLGVFGPEAMALARTEIGYTRPITVIESSFPRRNTCRSIRLFKSLTGC